MMKHVADFSYVVTANELEAYVLEANLIKQHRPRFNIVLRDDKNYPYLKLTVRDEWPYIDVVRKIKDDGALYFGPYVPAGAMRDILDFVRRNFQIRHCRFSLEKAMKPCIQFQMGRCCAPCTGRVRREEYARVVEEVRLFLKGAKRDLLRALEEKMTGLSEEMRYEEAAKVRDKIRAIERAMESQKIVAPELRDSDVIGFYRGERVAAFTVFFVRHGAMVGSADFRVHVSPAFTDGEALRMFMQQFYSRDVVPPAEVLAPLVPEDVRGLERWLSGRAGRNVIIARPQKGKKRELVEMAGENAFFVHVRTVPSPEEVLNEVRHRLRLTRSPRSIGALDISNIAGSEAVGAFVRWEDGAFTRDRYRRVRIRTVKGIDDYAMMREVTERMIAHLGGNLPDVLVIDGGAGHLDVVEKVIAAHRSALESIPDLVAIAKGPDRAFVPGSNEAIDLEDRSASSLLLKSIRDEAHRAAVGYHRKVRGKALLTSRLEGIKGIGKRRRLELLRAFGSIGEIKNATIEAIAGLKGFNRRLAEHLMKELESG